MKPGFILTAIFFYAAIMQAQNTTAGLTNDEIKTLVNKLGVKLLLNEKQKNELITILKDYSSETYSLRLDGDLKEEDNNAVINKTDENILTIFDEKQKMKYEIVKKEWWDQIKSEEND